MCALNINEMGSLSRSWLLWNVVTSLPQPTVLSLLCLFWPCSSFFHSPQRIFRVITLSKRPLRMHRGNMLTDFWKGIQCISDPLVALFTIYEAAVWFSMDLREHIYELSRWHWKLFAFRSMTVEGTPFAVLYYTLKIEMGWLWSATDLYQYLVAANSN